MASKSAILCSKSDTSELELVLELSAGRSKMPLSTAISPKLLLRELRNAVMTASLPRSYWLDMLIASKRLNVDISSGV
ncbi:hypothetical protein [Clostridium cavendishii]|uniref:hypothetical protein n=1 Tax=Clostridium cavendishii TaxID=349931 RepID=UPI001A9A30CA|nr:hypothetical protein [Clostridium cavendishii]